jgi:hypothetical protein
VKVLGVGATLWVNEVVYDRLIVDRNGEHSGMIDDIELTDPGDGAGPIWTAILCGPTALGPRIGGRLGAWWSSVAQRIREGDNPYPHRISVDNIAELDHRQVRLNIARDEIGNGALREWALTNVIERLPGGGQQ